jgi:hypothetical protein
MTTCLHPVASAEPTLPGGDRVVTRAILKRYTRSSHVIRGCKRYDATECRMLT